MPTAVTMLGTTRLKADAAQGVMPAARALLQVAKDLHEDGGELHPGATVVLGWWPFQVVEEAGGLRLLGPTVVCEPREDLTVALGLFAMQLGVCERVGVEPAGFDVERVVRVRPGILDLTEVMLARQPEPDPGSTGWHLRPDGPLQVYEEDYERLHAKEVVRQRPGLLAAMALPHGFIVRMRGDEIVAVLDHAGHDRWTAGPT